MYIRLAVLSRKINITPSHHYLSLQGLAIDCACLIMFMLCVQQQSIIATLCCKRLKEALDEIGVIRKREMEETAALEHMVQQVEANLSTTTVRSEVLFHIHPYNFKVSRYHPSNLCTSLVSLKYTPLYSVQNPLFCTP